MGLKDAAAYLLGIVVFLLGLTTTFWLYRYATGWGVYALQNALTMGFIMIVCAGLGRAIKK